MLSCERSGSPEICAAGKSYGRTSALAEEQLAVLLAQTRGQLLTAVLGAAIVIAAAFGAQTVPSRAKARPPMLRIQRWEYPDPRLLAFG
jgi:hypothetical protein